MIDKSALSSPIEMADEDIDDGDVVGCLPRVFAASHRSEIEQMIEEIPDAIKTGYPKDQNNFDRYVKLLDIYQEQPNLLDCAVPSMLNKLLTYVTLPTSAAPSKLDLLSATAMQYLSHLTKVRGYKVVVRLLPHQVSYLDKLICCLEQYSGVVGSDLHERHLLLLWLWIVCKNPFDLRRFDPSGSPGLTMKRIFAVAMPYLDHVLCSAHYASALIISQCLARSDGVPLLSTVLEEQIKIISSKEPKRLLGSLILVLAILKHVDRKHLVPHVESIVASAKIHFPLEATNVLERKCLIKLAQRIALVVLKPKIAAWRYRRGKRRLEENLSSVGTSTSNGGALHVNGNGCNGNGNGIHTREELVEDDDEDYHFPPDIVEWAIDSVLKALCDNETSVRWSAAKGVGRITARLPRQLTNQVVDSILSSNFHRLAGDSSWHGGCMALAELSRRGFLLPENLSRVFPIVQSALFYEEPMGRHASGRKVRDAACYVLWAFARAYEPDQLRPYINDVATSLMCAALFDREVNMRRAASAAFQENVGRQADFPDGIALLTVADYFAIGNRLRCYTKVCVEVIQHEKYADAIIDHLVDLKVTYWDETVRIQAAMALERLAPYHADYLEKKLQVLYQGTSETNPVRRHGYIISLAHCLKGLIDVGRKPSKEMHILVAELPSVLKTESVKLKASGGELTRKAVCLFIKTLADSRIVLSTEQVQAWLSRLEACVCDNTEQVRKDAAEAAAVFIPAFLSDPGMKAVLESAQEHYANLISSTPHENIRVGMCSLVAAIPAALISDHMFNTLTTIVIRKTETDSKWADGRRAAVEALSRAYSQEARSQWTQSCFKALFAATEDYTTSSRGDMGRLVREAAMRGLATVLCGASVDDDCIDCYVQKAVRRMVRQSAEKIGRTRECACEGLARLLSNERTRRRISDVDQLDTVYRDSQAFVQDAILLSMTPLLLCEDYYEDLIHGLIVSAGGVSEVTTKMGSQAILEYQSSIAQDSELMERLLSLIAVMLEDGLRVVRIQIAVLNILPQVLNGISVYEQRPDSSKALQRIVTLLKKIAIQNCASGNAARARLALNALCALLQCSQESSVWKTAVSVIADALSSRFPMVRRTAAEGLFESMCMSDQVDEQVLCLLSETAWQDTDDPALISNAAQQVQSLILGEARS